MKKIDRRNLNTCLYSCKPTSNIEYIVYPKYGPRDQDLNKHKSTLPKS